MTPDAWVVEAARVLAGFHRAALVVGLLFFAITIFKKWSALNSLGGPVGQVVGATLGGYAIPEALFPLYWIAWKSRPISDIPAGWLEIYAYIGSALIVLVSMIAIREAWK
jgi:hypothetical protein